MKRITIIPRALAILCQNLSVRHLRELLGEIALLTRANFLLKGSIFGNKLSKGEITYRRAYKSPFIQRQVTDAHFCERTTKIKIQRFLRMLQDWVLIKSGITEKDLLDRMPFLGTLIKKE